MERKSFYHKCFGRINKNKKIMCFILKKFLLCDIIKQYGNFCRKPINKIRPVASDSKGNRCTPEERYGYKL